MFSQHCSRLIFFEYGRMYECGKINKFFYIPSSFDVSATLFKKFVEHGRMYECGKSINSSTFHFSTVFPHNCSRLLSNMVEYLWNVE